MPLRPVECRELVHGLFDGRLTARELLEKVAPGRRQLGLFSGAVARHKPEEGQTPTTAERGPAPIENREGL